MPTEKKPYTKLYSIKWPRLPLYGGLSLILVCLYFIACSIGVGEKHMQLAEEFFRQGQYIRAVEEYTRVVNYGQRSALAIRAQTQIAVIYEQYRKDYGLAIRAYRDVYRRASDRRIKIEARKAVAKIYADHLQNPQAACDEYEALYNEFGKGEKEGADFLLAWAQTLMDAGRFNDAAQKFSEFRKIYPDHPEHAHSLLEEGEAYLADRRSDTARDRFKEIIEAYSNESKPAYASLVAEAYYGLGNALEMNDQLDAALAAYRQSLSMYPNRGVVELKIKRVEQRKKERQI